jgi:drug/metabolite transporter (DMT)-like permease
MVHYALALLCVVGIACGQILFKLSALSLSEFGLSSIKTLGIFFAAMCLYGVTSIAWVFVLRKLELGKVYPLMALAFVFVPVVSYFTLGERFAPQYFVGVALIVAGICVAVRA